VISGIGHAAFGASDLERTLDFYCRGLGLREAFRLYNDRGETWIVYVQVRGLDFLELFPDGRVGGQAAAAPGPRGVPSYRHLCLMVDDLQATLDELGGRGVAADGPARQGRDHNWQAWLTDPDGNRIELMQIMPDSPQHAAAAAPD
jgi:lactoylglutathione lyase